MKLHLWILLVVTMIIGIAMIPVIVSLTDDAMSGITETVSIEKNIDYDDLPIQIGAGDTLVMPLPEFRAGILYTLYIQNGSNPAEPNRWGFSTTKNERAIYTNGVPFYFETGDWDNPVFAENFSNEWFTWVVADDVGTFTFLQDFPVVIDTMVLSTGFVVVEYDQPSAYETDILYQDIEVPDYTNVDRLVTIIPIVAVIFLIGAVVVYIKVKN